MKHEQILRTLRTASPTTRERIKVALAEYADVLDSRISSMKSFAVKEKQLRDQVGFSADEPLRQEPSSTRTRGNANERQRKATHSYVVKTSDSQRNEQTFQSAESYPQAQLPSARSVQAPQLPAEEPNEVFTSVQAEVQQIFKDLRVQELRRHRVQQQVQLQRTLACEAPPPASRTMSNSSMLSVKGDPIVPHSLRVKEPPSIDELRSVLEAGKHENMLLKREVGTIMQQFCSLGRRDSATEAKNALSPSQSRCANCSDFTARVVEECLQSVFSTSRMGVPPSGSDENTREMFRQLKAAEEEVALATMRKVELSEQINQQSLYLQALECRSELLGGFAAPSPPNLSDGCEAVDGQGALTLVSTLHAMRDACFRSGWLEAVDKELSRLEGEWRADCVRVNSLLMLRNLVECVRHRGKLAFRRQ